MAFASFSPNIPRTQAFQKRVGLTEAQRRGLNAIGGAVGSAVGRKDDLDLQAEKKRQFEKAFELDKGRFDISKERAGFEFEEAKFLQEIRNQLKGELGFGPKTPAAPGTPAVPGTKATGADLAGVGEGTATQGGAGAIADRFRTPTVEKLGGPAASDSAVVQSLLQQPVANPVNKTVADLYGPANLQAQAVPPAPQAAPFAGQQFPEREFTPFSDAASDVFGGGSAGQLNIRPGTFSPAEIAAMEAETGGTPIAPEVPAAPAAQAPQTLNDLPPHLRRKALVLLASGRPEAMEQIADMMSPEAARTRGLDKFKTTMSIDEAIRTATQDPTEFAGITAAGEGATSWWFGGGDTPENRQSLLKGMRSTADKWRRRDMPEEQLRRRIRELAIKAVEGEIPDKEIDKLIQGL